MTTPAEIAARLTKAQRQALLAAHWRERDTAWRPEGFYIGADKRVRRALRRLGLITDYLSYFQRLTPLGLAVRAELERNMK